MDDTEQTHSHTILILPHGINAPKFNVSTLPHSSKHSDTTLCLLNTLPSTTNTAADATATVTAATINTTASSHYLELQSCTLSKYGSFFFHNRISSTNQILVASKFDVRFSLLTLLYAAKERYSPLAQILSPLIQGEKNTRENDGNTILFRDVTQNTKNFHLEDICDINDLGEGLVVYRYNEGKVLKWLRNKVEKVGVVLSKKRVSRQQKTTFASSFQLTAEDDKSSIVSSEEVTQEDTRLAVEIVCDCLNDTHSDLLIKSFGFTSSEVLTKHHTTTKRKADWEIELEKEQETAVLSTMTTTKPPLAHIAPPALTGTTTNKVAAKNEKANQVAAKGTKSISSFFKPKS